MTILLPDFNILFLSIIESFAQILRKLDINSLRYCCASLNHLLFTQSVYIRIFVRKLQLTTSFSNYYSQIPSFAFQVKPAKCVSFCFVMKNTFEVGFALLLPHPHCVEHLFRFIQVKFQISGRLALATSIPTHALVSCISSWSVFKDEPLFAPTPHFSATWWCTMCTPLPFTQILAARNNNSI